MPAASELADPDAGAGLRLKAALLKRAPIRSAAAVFGRDLEPRRWIFVIGCYNSGTTLLSRILARHPGIAALPSEGVRLTDGLPRPEEFGWNRMWCQCLDQVRLAGEAGGAQRARRVKRQWSLLYPRSAANLLEKSVANTARIPFLNQFFQPAFFVYIIRNGYAVAEGIRRKARPARWGNTDYREGYPIELCAEQWRASDDLVDADRAHTQRFLRISYEELTTAPEATAGKVTGFLGLEPLATEALRSRWRIHGVEAEIRNMNGDSIGRLSAEDIAAIHRVAGAALARNGYEAG